MPEHLSWSALGTYVHLAVEDDALLPRAATVARDVLAEVDRTCSRFREDSDLTRVNRSPGRWTEVHPLLAAALHVALHVAAETDGLVDPCLGRQLASLGYDADLGMVRQQGRASGQVTTPPVRDAWRGLAIDGDRVYLPPDVALDLGATAKAWASDLVAQSIADETGTGVLVSLGGDVSVVPGEADTQWPIAISERPEGATEELVAIESGGLATSSTLVRRWTSGGVRRHHLLDPRTGRPTDGPWRTVTATGSNCVTANAATTAALVLGDDALDWLQARHVTARLVHRSGEVATTSGWPAADRTRITEPA